ncbi:MAG: hypothetical protein KBT14_02050 [Proteobacteria bacterium]|nr:hypothetical protein [Candidatus Enterousia onthequi]
MVTGMFKKKLFFYGVFGLSIMFIIIPLFTDGYLFCIMQNIGFSILAAYVFYFVSVFMPRKEKQKQAWKILNSDKVNIISDMGNIIAIINGFMEIMSDNTIRSKSGFIIDGQAIIRFKINNVLYAENIRYFVKHYTQQLKRDIYSIITNRCFSNLDDESIDNILLLQQSGILRTFSANFVLSEQNRGEVHYGALHKDYQNFIKIYRFLSQKQNLPEAKEMTIEESKRCDRVINKIKHSCNAIDRPCGIIIEGNVGYIPK